MNKQFYFAGVIGCALICGCETIDAVRQSSASMAKQVANAQTKAEMTSQGKNSSPETSAANIKKKFQEKMGRKKMKMTNGVSSASSDADKKKMLQAKIDKKKMQSGRDENTPGVAVAGNTDRERYVAATKLMQGNDYHMHNWEIDLADRVATAKVMQDPQLKMQLAFWTLQGPVDVDGYCRDSMKTQCVELVNCVPAETLPFLLQRYGSAKFPGEENMPFAAMNGRAIFVAKNLKDETVFAVIGAHPELLSQEQVGPALLERIKGDAKIDPLLRATTNDEFAVQLVSRLSQNGATKELYQALKSERAKSALMAKMTPAVRSEIREADKAACERLIQTANTKKNDTFVLGGFYLGMDVMDADKLIGYYFPDQTTHQEVDREGDRVLYVKSQQSPFCYADKDGKVFWFNFGRKVLRKWHNYDVQTYDQWAFAYGREKNISMVFDIFTDHTAIEAGSEVSDNVYVNQKLYKYKYNNKGYEIIYYSDDKYWTLSDESGDSMNRLGGMLLKNAAKKAWRYKLDEPGTLRVKRVKED